jgi:hypothetical protein
MADAPKLKAMGVGEILDASFRLYKENFLKFVAILAVAYVPILVVTMVMTALLISNIPTVTVPQEGMTQEQMAAMMRSQAAAMMPAFIAMIGTAVLFSLIAQPLATGAITRAVGARYLNEEITVGKAYKAIGSIFFKYLGTILLAGLVTLLGVLCCVVPGLILMTFFGFASQVVVLEGLGGTKAMGRSRQLVRGDFWRVLGYFLLVFLLSAAVGWVLGFVGGLIAPLLASGPVAVALVNQAVQQVIHLFIMPYFIVVMILLYYDLRVRKEAFDLEILAKNLGASALPATPQP